MPKTSIITLLLTLLFVTPKALGQESFWEKYTHTSINMNGGLPHNFIDDFYLDEVGFVWIATNGGGIARFDGYAFENYDVSTECPLSSNFVHSISGDKFNRLWIASDGGIDILDLTSNTIVTGDVWPEDKIDIIKTLMTYCEVDQNGNVWFANNNKIYAISFNGDGTIRSISEHVLKQNITALKHIGNRMWIGCNSDIYTMQIIDARITLQRLAFEPVNERKAMVTTFFCKDNEVWLGTDLGLYRYDLSTAQSKLYKSNDGDKASLSQNRITDIVETSSHEIIISTLKGLNVYNPFNDNFEQITQDLGPRSLSSNFVNCMLAVGNVLMVGTEISGLDILSPNELTIHNYEHDDSPTSISANPVNSIIEDREGNLWVGNVESGLNKRSKGSNTFEHFTKENCGLPHNSVSALALDKNGHLWTGTWGNGISILDITSPTPHVVYKMTNLRSGFVGSLYYDDVNDGMWVGTAKTIYFIKDNQRMTPIRDKRLANMGGAIGSALDNNNRLWMGTSEGLVVIDLKTFKSDSVNYKIYDYKLDEPQTKLNPRITCITKSSNGIMYVGTNGYGFFYQHPGSETFIAITNKDGLANNEVRGIVEDHSGNIWISTNCGLSMFVPEDKRIVNYTTNNGLIDDCFYWNATYASPTNGCLYFGSPRGLTEIKRRSAAIASDISSVPVFTNFAVLNNTLSGTSEYMEHSIAYADKVSLHERDKSFTIEFSALNYRSPKSVRFQYMMVGFDNNWIETPYDRRVATYTNLPPANYVFKVRCSDGQGNWSEANSISISVSPFFYKTIWFYLLVATFTGLVLWQLYRFRVRNLSEQKRLLHMLVQERTDELEKQKAALEEKTAQLEERNITLSEQNIEITQQKESIQKMSDKIQKLSIDKLQFFTNISHEIRTPITLIIGPIQKAIGLSHEQPVIEQLQFVERNSQYLLQLINQLMDFRKVETGNMELHPTNGRLVPFVADLVHPFSVFASERNIRIDTFYRIRTEMVMFDSDAMNKVLTNLVSNAVKFSHNNGIVRLYIATIKDSDGRELLYICVRDNGEGVPEDELEKIFNRYYQSQNHTKYPVYGQSGTGIGLYLCKRIAEQAGGTIVAKNNKAGGCSFRVLVPFEEGLAVDDEKKVESMVAEIEKEEQDDTNETKRNILVVEDNKDMRLYIKTILCDQYNVIEAQDGVDGLTMLAENDIDFIICDIMMPIMDGIEFCTRVKNNFSFSHIPILILTAQLSDEVRTKSYKIGVESYLHKPFDEQMLLVRINGILEGKKNSQKKFQYSLDVADLNIDKESDDEKFVNKVLNLIKENYSNPAYSIDDILKSLLCSKSMLNKKMQNVAGQSPGMFIRSYRLNMAKELLMKYRNVGSVSISQIAYEVGFNDPKYFSRCFTKHFCIAPSVLLEGGSIPDRKNVEIDEE